LTRQLDGLTATYGPATDSPPPPLEAVNYQAGFEAAYRLLDSVGGAASAQDPSAQVLRAFFCLVLKKRFAYMKMIKKNYRRDVGLLSFLLCCINAFWRFL
jgi:hypothetical protein